MQLLSKYEVQALAVETMASWRPLERARYQYHMISPDPATVLSVLDSYQNPDGGFGNGIEPDFWLPQSSPMATSVGLQYLSELMPTDEVMHRIDKALDYLSKAYDARLKGWHAVPASVNRYPHAPWWHHTSQKVTEVKQWGNPTVELLGYFLKWHPDQGETTFKDQLDYSEKHLLSMDPEHYESHEIFCYLRTYPYLSAHRQARLGPVLNQAVQKLVHIQPEDWDKYVARPLDFVAHPRDERFGIKPEHLTAQLNYLALTLVNQRTISPTWSWEPWPGLSETQTWPDWKKDWPLAKAQWEGVLTLKALIQLNEYSWIR